MKALILAAGFGTRLLPHTLKIPKPLFTLKSKAMIEILIERLFAIGCEQILINTHHLHLMIKEFIDQKNYVDLDIQLIYEPVILDTGGAISNARPYLNDGPFFVINADIITNVDLKKVYDFHERSNCLATLVLHDYKKFNTVAIDDQGMVQNFNSIKNSLAFTGIQVLSPQIYEYFPDKKIFSSIDVYQQLSPKKRVKAMVEKDIFWSDIGTVEDYSMTSRLALAASQFGIGQDKIKEIKFTLLAGDGSDRRWFRTIYHDRSFIISDHGICLPETFERLQFDAFINIGNHLHTRKLFVPRILEFDALSGMVILEDLGDLHLETLVKQEKDDAMTLKTYKKVIDILIDFSIKGLEGFKKQWTCQSETYSKELILEKECRYFITAFIKGYLKRDVSFHELSCEFEYIADQAIKNGYTGLMHRDMQSRNIMIKRNRIYFIDFQSARTGPLQYDLASLLIDPYVTLTPEIKNDLLLYTMGKLKLSTEERPGFLNCYHHCCLTRNLQFLGAFGFLTQVKMKKKFEQYIPDAVNSLKKIIHGLNTDKIPRLTKLVQSL